MGNIDSKNIYIGNKGVVRGNLHFENNLTVLEGADIVLIILLYNDINYITILIIYIKNLLKIINMLNIYNNIINKKNDGGITKYCSLWKIEPPKKEEQRIKDLKLMAVLTC